MGRAIGRDAARAVFRPQASGEAGPQAHGEQACWLEEHPSDTLLSFDRTLAPLDAGSTGTLDPRLSRGGILTVFAAVSRL